MREAFDTPYVSNRVPAVVTTFDCEPTRRAKIGAEAMFTIRSPSSLYGALRGEKCRMGKDLRANLLELGLDFHDSS